jgi:hypothetical protein
MDEDDKKDLFTILKWGLGLVAVFLLLMWGLIACVGGNCVRGSAGQCCDPSTPCMQNVR